MTSSSTTGTVVFTPSTTPLTAISGTNLLAFQSNRFLENSSNARTVSVTGTIKIKSFNPFQQNTGKSLYFDGTGDYLTIPSNQSMGSASFTWEAWIYLPASASSYRQIISTRASSSTASSTAGSISVSNSGYLNYWTSGSIATGSTLVPVGSWVHVALVRNGTALAIYQNGLSVATATNSDNLTVASMSIGANYDGTEPFTGYISDARITRGYARYTTTFTPPTAPLQIK